MLRGQTQLACNLDSSEPDDSVSLVLWYKDSSMVPIFSLDARSSPTVHEARHKPGPLLEGRSKLNLIWLNEGASPYSAPSSSSSAADRETELATSRSRRHTSEWRLSRKQPLRSRRSQPEGENDDNVPVSSALLASANPLTQRGGKQQKLWAQLQIDSLSSEDNGVYVCRVDFRRARSRVQELALKIIVPADTPSIRDLSAAVPPTGRHGGELVRARVIGPHNEGSRIVLECETQGGYPDPSLSWWRNGRLVDDSYEIVSAQDGLVISQVRPSDGGELELAATGEEQSPSSEMDDTQATPKASTSSSSSPSSSSAPRLFRNRLELGPLTRNDLLANYSCEAPNSKLQTEPPSSFVMIDMNLRPVKVQIDNDRLPVLADRPLEIVCRAFGSRPAALISWFRGPSSSAGDKLNPQHPPTQQQQRSHTEAGTAAGFSAGQIKIEESIGSESNVTQSTLTIWPRPHDSGQIITCRAENPYMTSAVGASSSSSADSSSAAAISSAAAPEQQNSLEAWIEDSWKLEVHYAPRAQLQLGEKLHGQSIREGQDVYFECLVQAQPYAHEIRWWFNGKELESNLSLGVIVSNQSLVLQRVSRSQRGHYTCSAINAVGESHSSSLYLRVQFAPVCRDSSSSSSSSSSTSSTTSPSQQAAANSAVDSDLFRASSQQRFKSNYGAARMEAVRVFCHVDADPADGLTYKWAFLPLSASAPTAAASAPQLGQENAIKKQQQQQQQMVYLDSSAYGQEQDLGPLVSVATYTPRSELDYGSLLCWAQNELGQQADPCAYQLVAAEPPDPVRNCRLLNASDSQLVVACEPGYDGGVDQSFQMEVYDSRKRELVANVSSSGGGNLLDSPKNPAYIALLANNSIEQQSADSNRNNHHREPQDDSPASAALSLTSTSTISAANHQPKQRHSSHHSSSLLGSNGRLAFRHQQPASSPPSGGQQETLFITEPNLRPSTHYLLSIYSQNSKGSSKPVAFTATTANASTGPESARARFFSSFSSTSSSSSSQLSDSSHLLSDVLTLSWNPFLLVCAISVLLFVLFGSLTFAMMKYVDNQASEEANNNNNNSSSGGNSAELALKQSAALASCLPKSDDSQSSAGSCASTTNIGGGGGQTRRARIITLTSPSRGCADSGPPSDNKETMTREKVSLLNSGSSYLKMKLQQMQDPRNSRSQMNKSNSDNFLDQVAQMQEQSTDNNNRPPPKVAFSSGSLQRQAANGFADRRSVANFHHQRQLLGSNYAPLPGEQQQQQQRRTPRIEQLLISGKQYFHQAAPEQRHLQMTSSPGQFANSNQRYAAAAAAGSSRQQLCPHQQLIDVQAGENYCANHLQATAHQLDQFAAAAADQSLMPGVAEALDSSSSLHMAHLRLVEASGNNHHHHHQQHHHHQLAHIDSDSTTTNSANLTLPSLFSFPSHATTTTSTTTTNGSPSSGIAVATPTPTSQHHSEQQQQYCCGAVAAAASQLVAGSNSTITSLVELQQLHHHETEGGNVISVSDCLLGGGNGSGNNDINAMASSLSSASATSSQQHPHHQHHAAATKISQFDTASDAGFEEQNNTEQFLAYSAMGLPAQPHHIVGCQTVDHHLNQYSVYVDNQTGPDCGAMTADANNNQIYLLDDHQHLSQPHGGLKYPTKARVRVFSGNGSLDRSSSSYLKLVHPISGAQLPTDTRAAASQNDNQQASQMHTDV